MKITTNSFYIVLISFLVMYCSNSKPAKTDVSQSIKELKVTTTRDDLCRIVLKQQVFIDTSISRDKKNKVLTLLSDGTGLEVLYDESELSNLYQDYGYPTEYFLSDDRKLLLYDMSFFMGEHYLRNNIFLYNIDTKKRDSIFCEESTYTHERYSMFIESFKINSAGNRLIVSTNEFIRCLDLKTGQYFDINAKVPYGLVWINNTSFYFNRGYNKKWECQLFDITTKKSKSIIVNDTLPLKNVSATIKGERILKYVDIDIDTSGKSGDSLYFFNSDFKPVSGSFILNNQYTQYKIAPSGKWIYYTDERALRRVKIENVEGISQSLDDLNAKSQVIYSFPIMTDGDDITEIAYGLITQLLPVENGGK